MRLAPHALDPEVRRELQIGRRELLVGPGIAAQDRLSLFENISDGVDVGRLVGVLGQNDGVSDGRITVAPEPVAGPAAHRARRLERAGVHRLGGLDVAEMAPGDGGTGGLDLRGRGARGPVGDGGGEGAGG